MRSHQWLEEDTEGGPWFREEQEDEQVVPGTGSKRRGKQTQYKFYSKPVTNPLNILRRSAMPEGLKVAITAQEILRRLKTSGEHLPKENAK